MKKLIIAGGTGFLGQVLCDFYKPKTKEIIVLTRGKNRKTENIHYVNWDAKEIGEWHKHLNNADVLINLTGKSVNCRFSKKNKELILSSRIDSTLILAKAINLVDNPPKIWFNASTAALSHYPKKENGKDFMLQVGQKWENAFYSIENKSTQKIVIRISLVLGEEEGVLSPLKKITKLGLGGKQGNGKQMVSWIHYSDLATLINFLVEQKTIEGPIIAAAPNPITNSQFMSSIRAALGVPFGLPSFAWMLKIGSFIIGTEADLILNSMDVRPKKLLENGFQFKYPKIKPALEDVLRKS